MKKFLFRLFLVTDLLLLATIAHSEVAVIASPGFTVSSLSDEKLKKLWLGKSKKIQGIGRVFVSDQLSNTLASKLFYKKIIKKSMMKTKAHWAKIQFIGKGFPPPRFENDQLVMQWVRESNNRIGYINLESLTDEFTVLKKISGSLNENN